MKKIKALVIVVSTLGVAWAVGALGYFLLVSHHFSTIERKEDADKNPSSSARNGRRGSGRDARTPTGADWGNQELGAYLRQAVTEHIRPKTVQRTATGDYSGSKLW